jgi:two-component system sensor histidine kinase QseC
VRSIKSYLLSRLVGGAALVLALAGGATYLVVTRALEAQFDRNLTDRVQGFASILFQTEDDVEFEFSEQLMPDYERIERPAYFELWFADGRLLERSNSLAGTDLVLASEPASHPTHWTAPLPDGREGRYVSQLIEVHHVYPEEGPDRPEAARVLVVVARGTEELAAAERQVLLYCAAAFALLIGLIAVSSWMAVERGLEPAKRLAARLDAVEVEHLPAHLDVGELPRELAPVAVKTDLLIRRVDTALARERRTTADIAHELRTPISELLTVSEVALRDGQDPEGARRALGTIRDVAARMGRSVATLLELARLEMGASSPERVPLDAGVLVAELLRSLSGSARARGLVVTNAVGAGELVESDREVLRIILSNLLGNALRYASPGSVVTCRLERGAPAWRLVVENQTDELQPADLESLSEPFWRKDRARADREHSGLGLALSRALADKAGLALAFELEGRTFRAVLAPRAAARLGANQPARS